MNLTTLEGALESNKSSVQEKARHIKELIDALKNNSDFNSDPKGEMIAHLVLAYRHLEDACNRIEQASRNYLSSIKRG